jgi:predicted ATPase
VPRFPRRLRRALPILGKLLELDRALEVTVPYLNALLGVAEGDDPLDIARRQHARWWELRATTSLARLLMKQDRRDDARAMLSEIYKWFTEGFDTADLKDAKALLKELGG